MYTPFVTSRATILRPGVVVRRAVATASRNKSTNTKDSTVQGSERGKGHHKASPPHKHAPGWNEEHATPSEAHVKADQAAGTPSELQDRTVEHVRTQLVQETVITDEEAGRSTTAFYERDEVTGPLRGAEQR